MDESRVRVVLRSGSKQDEPLIYATWRKSAFFGVPRGTKDDARDWFKAKTLEIKGILGHAKIFIACFEDDPMTILGYSIATADHLNWIYVKTEFRKKGIGTLLLPDGIRTVTSELTKIGAVIAQKKNMITYKENLNVPPKESKRRRSKRASEREAAGNGG